MMSPNHGKYLGGQKQLANMSLCPTIYTPSHQASSCSEFLTSCTKSKSQFRKNPVFHTDDSTRCFCPCQEVSMFYIGLSELWIPMDTSKWFKMLNSDVILFGNMIIKHDKSLDLADLGDALFFDNPPNTDFQHQTTCAPRQAAATAGEGPRCARFRPPIRGATVKMGRWMEMGFPTYPLVI